MTISGLVICVPAVLMVQVLQPSLLQLSACEYDGSVCCICTAAVCLCTSGDSVTDTGWFKSAVRRHFLHVLLVLTLALVDKVVLHATELTSICIRLCCIPCISQGFVGLEMDGVHMVGQVYLFGH